MIARNFLNIALVLSLDLCILVTGAIGGNCCGKGWVKCCGLDLQLEDIAIHSPVMYGFGFPIKCCDFEKCMYFVKPEASITSSMAKEYSSVKIAIGLTHNLSEITAGVGPVKKSQSETRRRPAATYLQTLSLLC